MFRKRSKINASDENEVQGEKKTKEESLSNNNNDNNANSHHTNKVEEPAHAISGKWSSLYKSEDWWAVWVGLIIFGLSLPSYLGIYTLGWVPAAKSWLNKHAKNCFQLKYTSVKVIEIIPHLTHKHN